MRRPVFLSIFPGTNYSSPETNFFCWYHSSFWLPIVHLNFIRAQPAQLELYLDFLEEIAAWLHARGIAQWRPGDFRRATDYYRQAVAGGEVWLAYAETELVGTLRILPADPIVWPEVKVDDAVYVNTLAVRRDWAHAGVGTALLAWANTVAHRMGRTYVRLDCMADNAFLRRYYAQAGFAARGEIDADYPASVGTLRLLRFERPAIRNL